MNIREIHVASGVTPELGELQGSVGFIGTATVLIRFAGLTILTDPNFLHAGDHAHIGYGMTTKRLTEPALDIDELPPIDFMLLSHYHGDHFDQVAEARLDKSLPIFTTHHAARALRSKGFTNVRALQTWESAELSKSGGSARIVSMPGQHAPALVQAAFPPVMGEMLDITDARGHGVRIYLSGDTLLRRELAEIPKRYPSVNLGLFHLGGTRVLGLMVTMDADQGVRAVRTIDPQVAIPIHYDDYTVFKSPLSDFKHAAEAAGIGAQMLYLDRGQHCLFTVD